MVVALWWIPNPQFFFSIKNILRTQIRFAAQIWFILLLPLPLNHKWFKIQQTARLRTTVSIGTAKSHRWKPCRGLYNPEGTGSNSSANRPPQTPPVKQGSIVPRNAGISFSSGIYRVLQVCTILFDSLFWLEELLLSQHQTRGSTRATEKVKVPIMKRSPVC